MMGIARGVEIYRRIWWEEPFPDVPSQLILCEGTRG